MRALLPALAVSFVLFNAATATPQNLPGMLVTEPRLASQPCEEVTDLFADGRPDYSIAFRYGEAGELLLEQRDDWVDGEIDQYTRYTWISPGRIGEVRYDAGPHHAADAMLRFEYDDAGRLIRQSDDHDGDGAYEWIYEPVYEGDATLSSGEHGRASLADAVAERTQFTRDELGRVTEERVFFEGSDEPGLIVRYRYDGALLRATEEDFDADGEVDLRTLRQYGPNGRLLREEWESDAFDTVRGRAVFDYDLQQRLIRVDYDSWNDGSVDVRTTYSYDCDTGR